MLRAAAWIAVVYLAIIEGMVKEIGGGLRGGSGEVRGGGGDVRRDVRGGGGDVRGGGGEGREHAGNMKVIFLDVDGVLLPFGEACEGEDFTWESMKTLSRIMAETRATLVLSSTWRCGRQEEVLEQFRKFCEQEPASPLRPLLLQRQFPYTTCPRMHNYRQWEIARWLREEGRNVSGWCAIDDEELVSCSPEDGGGEHNL
eukprot:569495-Hanusia_phi.AAC.1